MTKIIKPPQAVTDEDYRSSVFLAGSIEMGAAPKWQEEVEVAISGHVGTILNPRRDDWDNSWEQSIDNPEFLGQVTWELSALDRASVVAIYFAPETKSPITLLELGLAAHKSGQVVVCCSEGFWRKGNVDIVCRRESITMVPTLGAMSVEIVRMIHDMRIRKVQ